MKNSILKTQNMVLFIIHFETRWKPILSLHSASTP